MLYLCIISICIAASIALFKKEIVWYFEQNNKRKLAELRRSKRNEVSKFLGVAQLDLISEGKKDKSIECSIYQKKNKAFVFYQDLKQEIDLEAYLNLNKIILIGKTYKNENSAH